MKKHLFCALLFLSFAATNIYAFSDSDQKAITHVIENIAIAWNDREGHGFADDYSKDADFVNIFGMHFSGKEEIEARHIKILQTFVKGSKFEVVDVKLREVKPDIVIAHVVWNVTGLPKSEKNTFGDSMKGIFTHVFIKNIDKWEITASQNTLMSK